jgi:hypothetical protein
LDGGAALAPPGTIIDFSSGDHFAQHATRAVIPINATCLDEEAWAAQLAAYPGHRHLLGSGWR